MAKGPYPYEPTPPHPGERQPGSESLLSRRSFIRNIVRIGVAGAVIPGTLTQLLPAVAPAGAGAGAAGPVIKRDPKTNAKTPITIKDLGNDPVVGEWGFLPAIIYRVKASKLEGSTKQRGYNTGQFAVADPVDPSFAIMVYRGKCKHLGCTVGWNGGLGASKDIEDYDGDGVPDGRILCPCHQGQYDIYDLAKNVPGTPPPAPLDVIRITIGDFNDPDGKIASATGAIIGTEVLVQGAYLDANQEGKGGAYVLGSQAGVV
ncbi:MAG: Rieske [2Fe-2S] domain [Thermoplasmata archaeon]|jgi:Rieske Fe-S protein|nr:Rieske [2Fe-2S] domain [Thermoplasmata archaeon]